MTDNELAPLLLRTRKGFASAEDWELLARLASQQDGPEQIIRVAGYFTELERLLKSAALN